MLRYLIAEGRDVTVSEIEDEVHCRVTAMARDGYLVASRQPSTGRFTFAASKLGASYAKERFEE